MAKVSVRKELIKVAMVFALALLSLMTSFAIVAIWPGPDPVLPAATGSAG